VADDTRLTWTFEAGVTSLAGAFCRIAHYALFAGR
jgi:hypothetical protein